MSASNKSLVDQLAFLGFGAPDQATQTAIEIAASALAALLGENRPDVVARLQLIITDRGLDYARTIYEQTIDLQAAADQPGIKAMLTVGLRWCAWRKNGERRTRGGIFLKLVARERDRAARRVRLRHCQHTPSKSPATPQPRPTTPPSSPASSPTPASSFPDRCRRCGLDVARVGRTIYDDRNDGWQKHDYPRCRALRRAAPRPTPAEPVESETEIDEIEVQATSTIEESAVVAEVVAEVEVVVESPPPVEPVDPVVAGSAEIEAAEPWIIDGTVIALLVRS